MSKSPKGTQSGMTLIEVLVSVLVLAIGLLGAAAIQLNALKYTDSSATRSQASFIAYDMMDRIRANVDGNAALNGTTDVLSTYALSSLSAAPSSGNLNNARTQDLFDFKTNVTAMGGTSASIVIARPVVTINIGWGDSRAASASNVALTGSEGSNATSSFILTSRIGVDP